MDLFTLCLYALCALFVGSIAYILWQKGFWPGLCGACAFFLSLFFALRYDVAATKILVPLKEYTTASFLAVLVIGSMVFGVITSQARPLKYYFSKKADKFANIAPLAVMIVLCVVLVAVGKRYTPSNAASVPTIGAAEKTDNSNGLRDRLGEFNAKLGQPDGDKVIGAAADIQKFFSFPLQITLVLVFTLWTMTGAWVAEDAPKIKKISNPTAWKVIFAVVFPLGMFIGILLPIFVVDALVPLLLFAVPALIYAAIHNKNVPDSDKVLTPDHFGRLMRRMSGGKKKKGGRRVIEMTVIDLSAYGKTLPKDALKARTEAARSLPGYTPFGTIVNNALLRRATMVQFDYNDQKSELKYFVDGLWHPVTDLFRRPLTPQASRELCMSMRAILGDNSPLDAEIQNRNKDEKAPKIQIPPKVVGQFFIEYDKRGGKKKKMAAKLLVQTKGSGEGALIQFERLAIRFGSYEKMRVGEKRGQQLKDLMNQPKGLLVFAAPPGQGLRTFTEVSLCETDRFTRDAATVEDVRHPYLPIENLPLTTYDSSKGETPMTVLPGVFFREPRLLLIRDLVNKETLRLCCDEIQNERMIITTLRAKTSAQALMLLLRFGIDPKVLADSLTAIVTQRLIRTLCPECKEEIPATDEMCRRVGIPQGRVKSFYRRRVHVPPEQGRDPYVPCKHCMETGYHGLAGLYDVIVVNDLIRQIMTTKPSEEAIQRAAMKTGGGTFLSDGVRMLAEGMTSFEELSRVLKQ